MQHHAFADAGIAIPPRPARAGSVQAGARLALHRRAGAARRGLRELSEVEEASLVGILALLAFWGVAELVLFLQGM
ncbi:hypothetical protein [Roseicella aquatilis]|uniref:Uncharacterized protein n=1 Tax=Roseicella aquatilis TaxID=2527868 RepID=A0A4R4D549_9PROT|nr:hypothetical protein [Roseicella aquatilis]TCZ51098.1 hypothetical protein EXY23_27125 [Roseicella aquatilis]